MKVGLLFGSFNPIHIGHLIIAEYLCNQLDEVWLVLSPQNPFKKTNNLLDQNKRLEMIETIVDSHPKINVSTVEFNLPKPSYTVNTLKHLKKELPQHDFHIIMGSDNILGIHKWRDSEYILSQKILVYPRKGYKATNAFKKTLSGHVKFTRAPILEISSTYIRNALSKENFNVRYMLHDKVWQYVKKHKLYQSV